MNKNPKGYTCKEFQRMIPGYINGNLSTDDLYYFLLHIEQCPECKEELTIQFMVAEGLNKLEENGSFDLNKELDASISSAIHSLKIKNISVILFVFGGLLVLLAIAAVFVLFFL